MKRQAVEEYLSGAGSLREISQKYKFCHRLRQAAGAGHQCGLR